MIPRYSVRWRCSCGMTDSIEAEFCGQCRHQRFLTVEEYFLFDRMTGRVVMALAGLKDFLEGGDTDGSVEAKAR